MSLCDNNLCKCIIELHACVLISEVIVAVNTVYVRLKKRSEFRQTNRDFTPYFIRDSPLVVVVSDCMVVQLVVVLLDVVFQALASLRHIGCEYCFLATSS